MQLQNLTLTNFRGLRDFVIDLGGKSAMIYGKNGTGKSTVVKAVEWMLYGKPLDGEPNFTPKTREGEAEVHGLNHSAELTIAFPLGISIIFFIKNPVLL